jgi:putative holliday junction resolvase
MKSAGTAIEISLAEAILMTSGRILALDLGRRRIGLAVSDELGITAQGLETLQRSNLRADLAHLKKLAADRNVTLMVVGNPLHMSGKEGRGTEFARDFAARLEVATGIPVQLWDERLTTVEAQRVLRESGASIEKRAKAVDRLAAVILLENFLDSRSPDKPRSFPDEPGSFPDEPGSFPDEPGSFPDEQ